MSSLGSTLNATSRLAVDASTTASSVIGFMSEIGGGTEKLDVLWNMSLITLGLSGALVLVTFVVYSVLALFMSRRASYNGPDVLERIIVFLAALWMPVGALAGALARTATTSVSFVISNARIIVVSIAISMALWLWTVYYANVIGATIGGYGVLEDIFRGIVLDIVLTLNVIFNFVYPWVNFVAIRIPVTIVRGFTSDIGACGAEAFGVLIVEARDFVLALGAAFGAWLASGRAVLTVAPDFAPAAQGLARTVNSLSVFATCTCASGTPVLLAPLFRAFVDGPPSPPLDDPPVTPFAVAVNASFAATFTVIMDVGFFGLGVRPLTLIIENIGEGDPVFEDVQFSINGTVDTLTRIVNGTLGFGTNVFQQYWITIAQITSGGLVPGVDFIAPPPVLFECATGLLMSPVVLLRTILNLVFELERTFTTYNGQLNWRLTPTLDSLLETVLCLCRLVRWLGDGLRFIGNDIQAACSSTDDCDSPTPCLGLTNYGRCVSSNVSDHRACTADTDCVAVDAFCAGGTSCVNAHSALVLPCSEASPVTVDPDCQRCIFDVGTCASGAVCSLTGNASECTTQPGACVAGVCHIRDAYNVTALPIYFSTCAADDDCNACYRAPAQCAGVCDDTTGPISITESTGCIFTLVAGLLDVLCCFIDTIALLAVNIIDTLWNAVIGTIYTLISRVDDFGDTRCPSADPEDTFFCEVPRLPFPYTVFEFFAFQSGIHRNIPSFVQSNCPADICQLTYCTTNAECTTQGPRGFAMELYGQGDVCNLQYNRCMHTPGTCALAGPVAPAVACVGFLSGACGLATCSGFVCPTSPSTPLFECACTCNEDAYRQIALRVTELGVCLGDSLMVTYGLNAVNTRCLVINVAALVAELIDLAFDLVTQTGSLLTAPDEALISTGAFTRAFLGVCDCFSRMLLVAAEGTPSAALEGLLTVLSKILFCACAIVVRVFDLLVLIVRDIALWIGSDIDPTEGLDFLGVVIRVIIDVIGLIFYVISFVLYIVAGAVNDVLAAADAFQDVGDFIKDAAEEVTAAILTLIELIAICSAALFQYGLQSVLCISQIFANVPGTPACTNLGDILTPCLEELASFILNLICTLIPEVCCFLRELLCALNVPNTIDFCPDITVMQCMDLNIFCDIEIFFCDTLSIDLDLGCTTNVCEVRPVFCFIFEIFCGIDLTLFDVLFAIQTPLNNFLVTLDTFTGEIFGFFANLTKCIFGPPPCPVLPGIVATLLGGLRFNFISGFPWIATADFVPPISCCIVGNTTFVGQSDCYDTRFIITHVDNQATNHTCIVDAKYGCWQFLDDETAIVLAFPTKCCQSPTVNVTLPCPSKKRKRDVITPAPTPVYEEPTSFDVNATYPASDSLLGIIRSALDHHLELAARINTGGQPSLASQARLRDIYAPLSSRSHRTLQSGAVLASMRDYLVYTPDRLMSTCLDRIDALVYDTADVWPPMMQLAAHAPTSMSRFVAASCMNYLESHAMSSRRQQVLLGASLATGSLVMPVEPATGNSLARRIMTAAMPVSSEKLAWGAAYTLELSLNTVRLLFSYAAEGGNGPPRFATLGLVGEPEFQMQSEHCTPGVLPAAILADWLTPTIGQVVRVLVGASSVSRKRTDHSIATDAVRRLAHVVGNVTSRLLVPDVTAGASAALSALAGGTVAHLKRSAPMRVDGMLLVDAVVASATAPRTPDAALRQHYAAQSAGREKRSARAAALEPIRRKRTHDAGGALSAWAASALDRVEARTTRLLRRALFGTDDMVTIGVQLAAANASAFNDCDLAGGAFECCPTQTLCTNCSLLDRVIWAAQAGSELIATHYTDELPNRYMPCISAAVDSKHETIVPPSLACPASICGAAECTSSAQCALYVAAGNTPTTQASSCSPTLGRCVLEGDSQCFQRDNETCFAASSPLQAGVCAGNVCVLTSANFTAACRCPDTYATVTKRVEPFYTRFQALPLPCLLNGSCLIESIAPEDSANSTYSLASCADGSPCTNASECVGVGVCSLAGACTVTDGGVNGTTTRAVAVCTTNAECDVCFPHATHGTWRTLKTRGNPTTTNADVFLVDALDTHFDGFGTRFVTYIEDIAFVVSRAGSDSNVAANAAQQYLFCDYSAGWTCPLAEGSAGTCNDRTEQRAQGAGLLAGLVYGALVLVLPLLLCGLCPCGLGACCTAWWPRLFLLIVWPVMMMFAYGGGLFCYTTGPLYLLVGIFPYIVTLVTALVRQVVSCALIVPRCVTCNLLPDFSPQIASVVGLLLSVLFSVLALAVNAPGLPACFGNDAYTLLSELVPPCFPLPNALINATLFDPTRPCAGYMPPIIQCATTEAILPTRFLDGVDSVLYIAEYLFPGFNAALASAAASSSVIDFLGPYALQHTTEAHAVGGDTTIACFWLTLPGIFWGAMLIALRLLATAAVAAVMLTVVPLVFYAMALGAIAVFHMIKQLGQGWVDDGVVDGDGGGSSSTEPPANIVTAYSKLE
jgi:hypothetical protein